MPSFSSAGSSSEGVVPLAIFAVVFIVVVIFMFARLKRQEDTLQRLARRLGGTVNKNLGWSVRLECTIDGSPMELFYDDGDRHSDGHVRIQFHSPPRGTLRLKPEGLFASLGRVFGSQDIRIGDKPFDDRFIIQGSPETWVREVIDPDFRRTISTLENLGAGLWGPPDLSLEAGPAGISVRLEKNLVNEPPVLDRFVDESIRIFRHIRDAGLTGEGIEILPADECAGRGRCPVCANDIAEPVHRCPTCATPHHAECWKYFGGCATYACGRRANC